LYETPDLSNGKIHLSDSGGFLLVIRNTAR
jgi:hypothetical protein